MIYVPVLKTRQVELRVIRNLNKYLSDKIIPLIEILKEEYAKDFIKDSKTGEFVFEQKGKRRQRKKEVTGIRTLEDINDRVNKAKVFVDFFRFPLDKYELNINKYDISKMRLSWELINDDSLYKNRIKELSNYKNMIPVISVKRGFEMPLNELEVFVKELQNYNNSIAIRVTDDVFEKYEEIIEDVIRESDYLLYDIEEQNPETKFIEIEELTNLDCLGKIILINSPRKAKLYNKEYPVHGTTDLIVNSAKDYAEKYKLHGYGDYCGLKDKVPTHDGSNGTGAALALLYDYKNNCFYSYANKDTSKGVKGYPKVIAEIMADVNILDPYDQCIAIQKISHLNSSTGNWPFWNEITMMRYIHQVHIYL